MTRFYSNLNSRKEKNKHHDLFVLMINSRQSPQESLCLLFWTDGSCAEYRFCSLDQPFPLKGVLFNYCRLFTLLFSLVLFCSILWKAFGKGRIQGSSSYRYSAQLEFLSFLRDGRTLGFCGRITTFLGICQSGLYTTSMMWLYKSNPFDNLESLENNVKLILIQHVVCLFQYHASELPGKGLSINVSHCHLCPGRSMKVLPRLACIYSKLYILIHLWHVKYHQLKFFKSKVSLHL